MSKVAVVYWSGTGNTEAMAEAVAAGAKEAGAEVSLITCADFTAAKVAEFSGIALGCPSMGDEVLEEMEFQPMYDEIKSSLSGLKVALFGSYGWGDGQWMREWEQDCKNAGITLACDYVIANDYPGDDEVEECKALGKALA